MKNIEKRIRYGWTLEHFLTRFNCSSEEELFKLMRNYYSRKTVNGYMRRIKKNSGIEKEYWPECVETIKIPDRTPQKAPENIQTKIQTQSEPELKKQGVIEKVVEFFKSFFK